MFRLKECGKFANYADILSTTLQMDMLFGCYNAFPFLFYLFELT